MIPNHDPRVDAFIAKSAPFAQPILRHLRELIHRGCPEVGETIKWGMPFFAHQGLLCFMAAFKAHCAFGFWHHGMRSETGGADEKAKSAMGRFGRVTSVGELPGDVTILRLIRAAVKLNLSGVPARAPKKAKAKAKLAVPAELTAGLRKNKAAAATFWKFTATQRKDYIEWITDAKREETRAKRLATTLEWLAEGKRRNWKYENC